MGLIQHRFRQRVLDEMHARPFAPLTAGTRLLHFGFKVNHEEAEADQLRFDLLVQSHGAQALEPGCRHRLLPLLGLRWERHGEFITYTIVVERDAPAAFPAFLTPPGHLLVAIDARLITKPDEQSRLVEAMLANGDARIASDFQINSNGFLEISIANLGMSDDLAGATVQRVLELETYRCFALLGLPSAEHAIQAINRIEHALPGVMEKMDAADSLEDNRHLLDLLSKMTLELERSSASTHFRLGATRAYSQLVRLRLDALAELQDLKRPGLTAFFSRRFEPAIRTCTTALDREAILARKLTRAAQLLRTRVEIALESQNRDLLSTMGERVRLQLRLQHTVEGLSVAAITYYIASLLHLVAEGAHSLWPAISPSSLAALSTPFILIVVAFAMLRIRRRHLEDF